MVKRLTDNKICRKITDLYPDYFTFDAESWFANPANYAYIEGENVAFGEYKTPGSYWVHFCFHTARGRTAIDLTKQMLAELVKDTNLTSAVGLIHEDNKPARWLIRQVGFNSLGLSDTVNGICEMFYYTPNKSTEEKNVL